MCQNKPTLKKAQETKNPSQKYTVMPHAIGLNMQPLREGPPVLNLPFQTFLSLRKKETIMGRKKKKLEIY